MNDDQPGETDREQLITKSSATFMVPQALLDDYAETYAGIGEWLGKALRGEIEPKPLPEPKRHRCVACWLVSLLPGHDRCRHGWLYCDDCASDY